MEEELAQQRLLQLVQAEQLPGGRRWRRWHKEHRRKTSKASFQRRRVQRRPKVFGKGPKGLLAEVTAKTSPDHEAIALEIANKAKAGLIETTEDANMCKAELLRTWLDRGAD